MNANQQADSSQSMTMTKSPQTRPAFGTVLADQMSIATYANGAWSADKIVPMAPIPMHPGAHVIHYASTCFEGFKAYRWADGSINVFRMDRHIERMRQSARLLSLPIPDATQLERMVLTTIDRVRAQVPEPPGALYMRPVLFGTMPNIGAASQPSNQAMLIVLASPVWDYFSGGIKPLRIYVEDERHRTAEHLGVVKTGGNYAAAMGPTLAAKAKYNIDQVLFCPDGLALPKISNVVSAKMFAITVLPVTLVGIVTVCELRVLSNSAFGWPLKVCAANAAGSCGFAVQSQ